MRRDCSLSKHVFGGSFCCHTPDVYQASPNNSDGGKYLRPTTDELADAMFDALARHRYVSTLLLSLISSTLNSSKCKIALEFEREGICVACSSSVLNAA